MAGLLLGGCVALRQGSLSVLPAALKGPLSHNPDQHLQHVASAFVAAAACDGLAPAAELAAACSSGGVSMAVAPPPPRTYNHTRRLTVPTYCLASSTRTRRRGRLLGGGGQDDDELFGGGGGDDGGWGGGDFWGNGRDDSDDEGGDGSIAASLHDLLLLWSAFCTLAFCQTVWHVSPKPKSGLVAPAFAALSYCGIKARLLSQGSH